MGPFHLKGTRVRLKYDPGSQGECTGEFEDSGTGTEVRVSILGRRATWFPIEELELIEEAVTDPITMMLNGQAGRARDLRRELARVQLNGRLSEMFYSMDTTNTEFHPHQFKPVLAMLDSPSQGLLIADEVGLGKTIEAGLIWTELRFRKQARRLLVVCPAMLTEKWKLELRHRFGTIGVVSDARGLLEAISSGTGDAGDNQCLICSLQGIRPPNNWDDAKSPGISPAAQLARALDEASADQPLFDLVVIDEAHYLRNAETSSAALGRLLRAASSHVILLTATPVNTRSSDLFSLLQLIDPDQFRYQADFSAVLEANRPLVVATTLLRRPAVTAGQVLAALKDAGRAVALRGSEQLRLIVEELEQRQPGESLNHETRVALSNRVDRANLLAQAVTRTRKREVLESRVTRVAKHQPVPMSPAEQTFYARVTEAVRALANGHEGIEGFLLAMPQRQMSSCMVAAARRWIGRDRGSDDEETAWEALDVADVPDSLKDSAVLSAIRAAVQGVSLAELKSTDSKFAALRATVREFLRDHPSEKLIVFSYFRGTLAYLHERFSELGIESVVVQGGDDKNEIIERFQGSSTQRVLLSSEVASEGVDLQFMRFLVNYDLPWNPMKVEQRIGRIDRLGQASPIITILNLVYGDTIDDRILNRLYARLELFERALGGTEDILGTEIAEMTRDLLSGRLTPEQENARIEQTRATVEQKREHLRQIEEHENDLIGLGDFVRQRIIDARNGNRRVADADLLGFVQGFLDEHAHGHTFKGDPHDAKRFTIRLPSEMAVRLEHFVQSRRLRRTLLSSAGEVRVRLENQVAAKLAPREELLNQFHPLIAFISDQYSTLQSEAPIVSVSLARSEVGGLLLPGVYAFQVESWSFTGSRDEELLRAAIISLDGRFQLTGLAAVDALGALRRSSGDWIHFQEAIGDGQALIHQLENADRLLSREFAADGRVRQAENEDRIRLQRESIQRNLERRRQTILARVEHARINRLRTLRAEEGKLKAREREAELLLARLDHASEMKRSRRPACSGLLQVD